MKRSEMTVECIDHMGSDLTVANCARVSFAKESASLTKSDEKLIKYLADHNHWSPFAHCFLSFRIKAPCFVARQLVKHQVGLSWNEESRRYIDEEPEFYFPDKWRKRHPNKKQGSYEDEYVEKVVGGWYGGTPSDVVEDLSESSLQAYNILITAGVAPEQARMVLSQNVMFSWIWSGSLYAFARVCNLRLDPHAQLETRMVAEQIYDEMMAKFPVSTQCLVPRETLIIETSEDGVVEIDNGQGQSS